MSANLIKVKDVCRKIIGVGLNYKSHSEEMKIELPKKPLIFGKPISSIIVEGQNLEIPSPWDEVDHEVELAFVIGKPGKSIKEKDAMNHVAGYLLALDMTARKPQIELMKNGHPWLISKGFDTACAVSKFIPKEQVKDVYNLELMLAVNGVVKQRANTSELIFKIPELVSYISKYFRLDYGDLILTGTPVGISPVRHGDVIDAEIKNLVRVKFPVVKNVQ